MIPSSCKVSTSACVLPVLLCTHLCLIGFLQALQLLLLRRLTQQVLGPSNERLLPEPLLADAVDTSGSSSPGGDFGASHANVRLMQDLQALAASSWPLRLSTGARSGASVHTSNS